MTDELVSSETAILSDQKGFDEICYFLYEETVKGSNKFKLTEEKNNNSNLISEYSAPTQSLLQRWLREKHKIRIYPKHGISGNFNFEIYIWNKLNNIGKWTRKGNISPSPTFEKAFEKGLLEGLKLIKS